MKDPRANYEVKCPKCGAIQRFHLTRSELKNTIKRMNREMKKRNE